MTRPTPTISQMIDRNNRQVRMRRLGLAIDQLLMKAMIGAVYLGAAFVLVMMFAERIY